MQTMKQREIKDKEGITWTCVQALAGMEGKAAEKATKLIEDSNGHIPVVCTPSGGAQSVRLSLHKNWFDQLSDKDLLKAITDVS